MAHSIENDERCRRRSGDADAPAAVKSLSSGQGEGPDPRRMARRCGGLPAALGSQSEGGPLDHRRAAAVASLVET